MEHYDDERVSPLYFECHITIEPVFDDEFFDGVTVSKLEIVRILAKDRGFRVADLLMQKRTDDTEARSKHDTFCTGRSKVYGDILHRMTELCRALKIAGFKVWRAKIEDTIYDTKYSDSLGIL